jgi:hypothetical protein
MGLLAWFKGTGVPESRRARDWRSACLRAAGQADDDRLDALRFELESWRAGEEDIEVEREMLEGGRDLVELTKLVRQSGLPVVETGHRVVGTDVCHFTAPSSMPDEAGQPGGRLLLTSNRAIFVGGARSTAIPWHAIGRALHAERDVVLIRTDREQLYRFRCNSFSDAFRGAFIGRELLAARRARTGL